MKTRSIVVAFSTLLTFNAATADQLSDFSVFQPTDGVVANIYVSQKNLVIKTNRLAPVPLVSIKNGYLNKYPDQLYMLNDINNDGVIEVAALKSVNTSLNEFCYSVYSYNTKSLRYENNSSLISCKKGYLGKTVANK